MYEIATGISECAECHMRWRGPRVAFFTPPADEEDAKRIARDIQEQLLKEPPSTPE